MFKTFEAMAFNGVTYEIRLKTRFEVCGQCKGKGVRVNPSIDSEGLTFEDFQNDPDFEESYFSGVYDIKCDHCDGKRVTEEIDENAVSPEVFRDVLRFKWESRLDALEY